MRFTPARGPSPVRRASAAISSTRVIQLVWRSSSCGDPAADLPSVPEGIQLGDASGSGMSTDDDVSVPRGSPEGLARAEVSAAPLRRVYDADAYWGQVSSQARTGQLGSICIAILLHRWYSPPPSPSDLLRAAPPVAPDHGRGYVYMDPWPVLSASPAHRGGAQSRRVILGVSLPSTPSSHSCSSRSTNSERGSSRQRSSSW